MSPLRPASARLLLRAVTLSILIGFLGGCAPQAEPSTPEHAHEHEPALVRARVVHDFGVVAEGELIPGLVSIPNTTQTPWTVSDHHTGCGCLEIARTASGASPGHPLDVELRLRTDGRSGAVEQLATVQLHDSSTIEILAHAFVLGSPTVDPAMVLVQPSPSQARQEHSLTIATYGTGVSPCWVLETLTPGVSWAVKEQVMRAPMEQLTVGVLEVDPEQLQPGRQLLRFRDVSGDGLRHQVDVLLTTAAPSLLAASPAILLLRPGSAAVDVILAGPTGTTPIEKAWVEPPGLARCDVAADGSLRVQLEGSAGTHPVMGQQLISGCLFARPINSNDADSPVMIPIHVVSDGARFP